MAVTVETLPVHRIAEAIDALASLRIAVFREWPYLYDGDAAYEREYLAEFAAAPDAALVEKLTCLPEAKVTTAFMIKPRHSGP